MAILAISILGCRLTSVEVPEAGTLALGLAAVLILSLPVILFLHERRKLYLRDSLLTFLWAFYFTVMLGYPVTIAARLGMNIPMQDARFVQWDRWLGVYVPGIQAWADHNWLGALADKSYPLLFAFMRLAVLLPIFAGKLRGTQRFLIANLAAFALGLPVFAVLPGIAPWYGYHLIAGVQPAAVLLLIRHPGPYLFASPDGAICFPSFHVIWALLCVQAFWGLRWLRIPAALFAALIVFSTLTTGNHYLCDVLAGILLALAAMAISHRLTPPLAEPDPIAWLRAWRASSRNGSALPG